MNIKKSVVAWAGVGAALLAASPAQAGYEN